MNKKRLTTKSDKLYKGFPIMSSHGPFYVDYLEAIHRVMSQSLKAHPRTAVFRFDLRLPDDYHYVEHDRLIERFIASLKSKIGHSRKKAKQSNPGAHTTEVRYNCAREYTRDGKMHFHFIVYLNKDAYFTLGKFEMGRDNLYSRIAQAWNSALGGEYKGLLYVPSNPVYILNAYAGMSIETFFYRASYIAKARTKVAGRRHGFLSSRR